MGSSVPDWQLPLVSKKTLGEKVHCLASEQTDHITLPEPFCFSSLPWTASHHLRGSQTPPTSHFFSPISGFSLFRLFSAPHFITAVPTQGSRSHKQINLWKIWNCPSFKKPQMYYSLWAMCNATAAAACLALSIIGAKLTWLLKSHSACVVQNCYAAIYSKLLLHLFTQSLGILLPLHS